ncbi:LysR family transcriptional regulator (plasmid) [Rhizobium sp. CB3060]|uniref:LysR family transcriptional regulator n=1 Tax=Rhizobium sp. CB3060 TaxID=3138255 RepID=UPI0021A8AD32|nr:LysR family transcriptional regulator [Rhizobium tropici]UWU25254.1 LysR family transcriptional regulator [Rhizobium tropici]
MGARLPPLRLLTVFETVLRTGSVQKAASDLNVTQPAVSQALKTLEDYVGTRLLDRSKRPATLTEAGRILQAGVSEGLGRIAEAFVQLRSLQNAAEQSVTVACSVGTATYWLMPRLADFYSEHQNIAVNVLTTAGAPEFQPGVDLVIRYGTGRWTDGRSVKLFDERVVPVCSPLVAKRIEAEGGLSTATLLHVRSDDNSWLTWKDYLSLNGLPENRALGRYFTNYVQATQAVLSGQGVLLGWESNAGDLVREGRLVVFGETAYYPKEAFFLVSPTAPQRGEAVRLLTEWIVGLGAGSNGVGASA